MNTKPKIDFWHCEACEWVGEKHEAATNLDGNATKLYCPDCHNTLTKGSPKSFTEAMEEKLTCRKCEWEGNSWTVAHDGEWKQICPNCGSKDLHSDTIHPKDKPVTESGESW